MNLQSNLTQGITEKPQPKHDMTQQGQTDVKMETERINRLGLGNGCGRKQGTGGDGCGRLNGKVLRD